MPRKLTGIAHLPIQAFLAVQFWNLHVVLFQTRMADQILPVCCVAGKKGLTHMRLDGEPWAQPFPANGAAEGPLRVPSWCFMCFPFKLPATPPSILVRAHRGMAALAVVAVLAFATIAVLQ